MKDKLYLITGANGHLGSVLVDNLLMLNKNVRCLLLENEKDILSNKVEKFYGDVRDKESLRDFFNIKDYQDTTLIHMAAKVTILSKKDKSVFDINVDGTKSIMDLALENNINRVIHVSSVHSIKESEGIIKETLDFNPDYVVGQYAKSKALANMYVLESYNKGLNVTILFPSGIIGPGDKLHRNNSVNTIRQFKSGAFPCSIDGAYDFVDVRDVAKAIINAEFLGKPGQGYILSGRNISVKEVFEIVKGRKTKFVLPTIIAKIIAPIYEWYFLNIKKELPLLTPYSIFTLHTNANFSNEKARKELGFNPRDIKESILDSLD